MSELPAGWASAPVNLLCEKLRGVSYAKEEVSRESTNGRVPILRANSIVNDKLVFEDLVFVPPSRISKEQYLKRHDVVVAMSSGSKNVVGKTAQVHDDWKGAFGAFCGVLRPTSLIDGRYFGYFFHTQEYRSQISELAAGTSINNLKNEHFEQIEFPVAPLAEQRRIVAKLEVVLGKVAGCQHRLAKLPVLLKRFRQSVLAAACSGKITADWRKENPDVEPVTSLVKETRFPLIEPENGLPELPDSWVWIALGNYSRCFRGRFSPRPRNDPRYFDGKHPFIQIGDLPPDGGLVTGHRQTLNDEGLAVSRKFSKGTVVIAIVGATIGNTGILAYDMCVTDSIVGIETGNQAGNQYVEFFLRHKKHEIRQGSYSSGGQPNIKLETLNPYPLALPPLAEQQEIVRRVEALFALAEQIASRSATAQAQVDKLTPSLLAKAFRGDLVPQDPNDEPAAELIKRIRNRDRY